jgi:hypothetical protein
VAITAFFRSPSYFIPPKTYSLGISIKVFKHLGGGSWGHKQAATLAALTVLKSELDKCFFEPPFTTARTIDFYEPGLIGKEARDFFL